MSVFLNNTGKLLYLGEDDRKSKDGNPFTLVKIADSLEFQTHQFFKSSTCNTDGLEVGTPVSVELNLDTQGFNQRINITKVTPLK